jgi:hypothetical protein
MTETVHYLTVGPVRFVLRDEALRPVRYEGWAYRGFFTEGRVADVRKPQSELPVKVVQGGLRRPAQPPLYEAGGNWSVWPEADGLLFCSGYAGRELPRASCHVSRALDRATLYVDGDPGDAPLRYPLDQVLTWGLLARCGGVLLHAAAVVRDGVGLVLAGRSGAGKSTLSALCRADGWQVLNDDRVVLFRRDGRPFVAGTPWHGSGCFAEAAEVPLAGVLLLEQASTDRLEPLDGSAARLSLLHAASIPWFEDAWSQAALNALDDILHDVPAFRFQFTKTPAAVRALERRSDCRWEVPV